MEPEDILHSPEFEHAKQNAASGIGDTLSDIVDGGSDLLDIASEIDLSGIAGGLTEGAGELLGILGSLFD